MSYRVIIPARLGSARLPGKPLKDIYGKSLLQRVVEQANESNTRSVHVATDSQEIIEHCNLHNIQAFLTNPNHKTGSDRLAESCSILDLKDDELIINVQCDEPFIDPEDINNLASLALSKDANMVTLFSDLDEEDTVDENVVKLWVDSDSLVKDFSRDINYLQAKEAKKHIGLYGYKVKFLKSFVEWKQSYNETKRNLEQMRAMDNGVNIFAIKSQGKYDLGVDTAADLLKAIKIAKELDESY